VYLETAVKINATPSEVWAVFTDRARTIQMGGEYITSWKVGESISWNTNGKIVTHGEIISYEPQRLLKHHLFTDSTKNVLSSTITYEIKEDGNHTILTGREEFETPLTKDAWKEASEGWQEALNMVKKIAEK
jgi:uncharacterized protein YndB with AHSA1/START domain